MAVKAHIRDRWKSAYVEPERLAFVQDGGSAMTYRQLVGRADRIGHALVRMGLPEGARTSILLPARPEVSATAPAVLERTASGKLSRAAAERLVSRRRAGSADAIRAGAI